MVFVKINDVQYPAVVNGNMRDTHWDDRQSKSITLTMDYQTASDLFVDGLEWSIIMVQQEEVNGEVVDVVEEFRNDDYNIAGDITDHRDGTITAKMGCLTALEEAYEMLLGGI